MKKVIIILVVLIIITGCTSNNIKNSLTKNSINESVQIKETQNIEKEEKITNLNEEVFTTNDITVINYVNNLEAEVMNFINTESSKSIKEKLKTIFITLTDFIFYNGTINGITFNELSASAQEKVLEIYMNIDKKIENYYPHYKETIKSTSQKVYTNVIEKANNLKETYKQRIGEESYKNTKEIIEEDLNKLKESVSPTIDYVKENSINVYEELKEHADNWYQNYKERGE